MIKAVLMETANEALTWRHLSNCCKTHKAQAFTVAHTPGNCSVVMEAVPRAMSGGLPVCEHSYSSISPAQCQLLLCSPISSKAGSPPFLPWLLTSTALLSHSSHFPLCISLDHIQLSHNFGRRVIELASTPPCSLYSSSHHMERRIRSARIEPGNIFM